MEVSTDLQGKCTKSLVQIVERKQKFLSNQMAPALYTVESAINNINQKDFRIKSEDSARVPFFTQKSSLSLLFFTDA